MRDRVMRSTVSAALVALAGCGGDAVTPPAPSPPPADFTLSCQPAGFPAPRGCASSTCTVVSRNGFSGPVTLSCSGQPSGLTCTFGPRPLNVSADRTVKSSFLVSADLTVASAVHAFEVVGAAGGLRRATTVQVQTVQPTVAPPRAARMTFYGCAGSNQFGIDVFHQIYVGAWRGTWRGEFCDQVLSESDGSFALELSRGCVEEGQPAYLTAGGLDTCVAPPFQEQALAHVTLIGRTAGTCPATAAEATR